MNGSAAISSPPVACGHRSCSACRSAIDSSARSRHSIRQLSRASTSQRTSSSSARRRHGRKAFASRRGAVHVCYINTPSRFLFAYDRYIGGFGLRELARPLVASLAAWDKRAALRPTAFIANSHNVAQRVRRYYGREAFVLPCPADVDRFTLGGGEGDYFLVLSRLLPYKAIDRAIDAAALAGVKLRIAGSGPAEGALRAHARGTTTEVLGYVPDDQINALVGSARAVIVPGEEDFGLVPLEAAAAGRPTIALRAGGALETIRDGVTGTFFDEGTAASLARVLKEFEPARLRSAAIACARRTIFAGAFHRSLTRDGRRDRAAQREWRAPIRRAVRTRTERFRARANVARRFRPRRPRTAHRASRHGPADRRATPRSPQLLVTRLRSKQ